MAENYTADEEAQAVPRALAGLRLDRALVRMFPQYSRNRLQAWLKSGHVKVKRGAFDILAEASTQVVGGETIELMPPPAADASMPPAQRLPLEPIMHWNEW